MTSFEKDYFVKSKTSNYQDYRTKKFEGLCNDLITLGISHKSKILDYGCGTGGLISQFKKAGLNTIQGTDISEWAIDWGRKNFNLGEDTLQYYNRQLLCEDYDYIFMLDVLEHLPDPELERILKYSAIRQKGYLIVRIPVSMSEGEDFVLDVSKNDKTHIQIHCKDWWMCKIAEAGYHFKEFIKQKNIYHSEGVMCAIFEVIE